MIGAERRHDLGRPKRCLEVRNHEAGIAPGCAEARLMTFEQNHVKPRHGGMQGG
ncbi:hypothetical protein LZK73_31320 (plasmid) [Neorhizobium galegae]|nr:hypothetical protein LZK73_31320 [Neorhizobium galegae]